MMLMVQERDDDDFVDAAETLEQQGATEELLVVVNAILGDQGGLRCVLKASSSDRGLKSSLTPEVRIT